MVEGRERDWTSGGVWLRIISDIEGTILLRFSSCFGAVLGRWTSFPFMREKLEGTTDSSPVCRGLAIGVMVEFEVVLAEEGRNRRRRAREVEDGAEWSSSSLESSEALVFLVNFLVFPPPRTMPGGGVGNGGWYRGWCPGIPNLERFALIDELNPSPPFIPSTNASIVSTPEIGAATSTGK